MDVYKAYTELSAASGNLETLRATVSAMYLKHSKAFECSLEEALALTNAVWKKMSRPNSALIPFIGCYLGSFLFNLGCIKTMEMHQSAETSCQITLHVKHIIFLGGKDA